MKCIRYDRTKRVERVSDDEAHRLVSVLKVATYVPKRAWKEEMGSGRRREVLT